jgi:hypothetical protein
MLYAGLKRVAKCIDVDGGIFENVLWWIWSTHGWATARWIPSSLIACQQYMIIAMQRLDKHLAIRTCNNRSYVSLVDVITRY